MRSRLIVGVGVLSLGMMSVGGAWLAAPSASAQRDESPSTFAHGLIVRTDPGRAPLATTSAALRIAAIDDAMVEVGQPGRIAPSTTVVDFDGAIPLDEAERIAEAVAARPGIAWAEPDIVLTSAEEVFPDDPLFENQWYLWDADAVDGGWSARTPSIWAATIGEPDVIVAVVDTGVADHPDLSGTVIPGYDFVSNLLMANDVDSWDPNPADPGDWVTSADIAALPSICTTTSASSWHGTHVAGIAAAVQNNAYGISGAAPGLTVQNVRALGKCGGLLSDIAAAVRWSVGDVVIDPSTNQPIPVNPTPAKVVNLSLGGVAGCSAAMSEAVRIATSRGAVVVAAAGNKTIPLSEYVPANCPGVVSVVSTERSGSRSPFSNFGTELSPATISAPGGGPEASIQSTMNTGLRGPEQPSFGYKNGTSMAAPVVSAAVGMLFSLGAESVTDARSRLIESTQEFPATIGIPCEMVSCGAGIVDFGLLADSINLSGRRGIVRDRPGVIVDGVTVGLSAGTTVTPYVKLPGQTSYTAGTGLRQVTIVSGIRGTFTWQRQTGKKVYVYFLAETGERSQRIIIPAR